MTIFSLDLFPDGSVHHTWCVQVMFKKCENLMINSAETVCGCDKWFNFGNLKKKPWLSNPLAACGVQTQLGKVLLSAKCLLLTRFFCSSSFKLYLFVIRPDQQAGLQFKITPQNSSLSLSTCFAEYLSVMLLLFLLFIFYVTVFLI